MDKTLKVALYSRIWDDPKNPASEHVYAMTLKAMIVFQADWSCAGVYIDHGADWTAYDRMCEDAAKGVFDAVIVRNVSVFAGEAVRRIRKLPSRVYMLGDGCIRLLPQKSILPSPAGRRRIENSVWLRHVGG